MDLTLAHSDRWHARYNCRVSVPMTDARAVSLRISVEADATYYLSSKRELLQLVGKADPPPLVGRFIVVEQKGECYKLDFPWATRLSLAVTAKGVDVATTLFDRRRCGHLLLSSPDASSGRENYELAIHQDKLDSPSCCLWLEPYPRGALAAICLTDHADFDTVTKLEPITDLFARNQFLFTKSVFPQSDPAGHRNEIGLDQPEYRKVIDRLHAGGTEIAFHGFGPRNRTPSMDECIKRVKAMEGYEPRTWIDHGHGSYLFAEDARLADGSSLTAFLGDHGVNNYWSYCDVWNNPFRDLSSWARRRDVDVILDLFAGFATFGLRSPAMLAYVSVHALRNVISDRPYLLLKKNFLSGRAWRMVPRYQRLFGTLRASPIPMYNLRGQHFLQGEGDLCVFDTLALNHLAAQLRPSVVDRLIGTSGLLLGHCYLCADRAGVSRKCFSTRGHKTALDPLFVRSVEYIGDCQERGEVVSLSFRELRASLAAFSGTVASRTANGWTIDRQGKTVAVLAGAKDMVSRLKCDKAQKWIRNELAFIEIGSNADSPCTVIQHDD